MANEFCTPLIAFKAVPRQPQYYNWYSKEFGKCRHSSISLSLCSKLAAILQEEKKLLSDYKGGEGVLEVFSHLLSSKKKKKLFYWCQFFFVGRLCDVPCTVLDQSLVVNLITV